MHRRRPTAPKTRVIAKRRAASPPIDPATLHRRSIPDRAMFTYPARAAGTFTRILQGGLEGAPVILLHGLSARADRWKPNLDALGVAGLRAIAVDLPGHGLATKGRGFDYSARGYSRWLDALLASLQIPRAVIVGTSFGGLIAMRYAADFPERVAGLMCVGAIGLVPAGLERRMRTVQWLKEMGREQIRDRLRRGLLRPELVTDELVEEDWRINNSPGAAEAFEQLGRYYQESIDDDAAAPRLAAAGTPFPVHLVWGAKDASVSVEYGEAAQRLLPGTSLDLVEGCGHFPYWERPEAFNPLLIRFVQRCMSTRFIA
jgi:pimeloyl-ACP methyl ester carboxylesterase